MYTRKVKQQIVDDLFRGKVIMLYGPRRVGKTTIKNGFQTVDGKKFVVRKKVRGKWVVDGIANLAEGDVSKTGTFSPSRLKKTLLHKMKL